MKRSGRERAAVGSLEGQRAIRGRRGRWQIYAGLFAFALIVRLTYLVQIKHSPTFETLLVDAFGYDRWAQDISAGHWVGREVFYQAPLYPYFLAANYVLFGHDLLAVRIVQVTLGALSCVFLAVAGCRFFSFRVGIAAGVLLAVYPIAIFFDTLIQKSVLDLFFMTLLLLLLGTRSGSPRWYEWLLSGMVLGLLALTRENALALAPLIVIWIWLRFSGKPRGRRLQWSLLLLSGLMLILLPVGLRNRLVGGEFFVTTAQFGPNLYIGNHENASGRYVPLRWGRSTPEFERRDATELAEAAVGRRLTPREVSRYWTEQALRYIRSHPVDWLQLMARKWALTWNASEVMDAEDIANNSADAPLQRLLLGVVHFGVLCPLAVLGIVVTSREWRRLWILYVILASIASSVAVFYVFARYRFPMVPVIILFAAAGLFEGLRLFQREHRRELLVACGFTIVAAVFVNLPIVSGAGTRAAAEYNLGVASHEQGAIGEAMRHYREAVRLKPDFAQAYYNLGVALAAEKEIPEAIAQYETALRLKPDFAEAHNNLAELLVPLGRTEEAIRHYEEVLRNDVQPELVHFNLAAVLAKIGKPAEAEKHFLEGLRIKPDDLTGHRDFALLLDRQGRHAEAAQHYIEALRISPESAEIRFDYGQSLLAQGRRDEAASQFREALRIKPDFSSARARLDALRGSAAGPR